MSCRTENLLISGSVSTAGSSIAVIVRLAVKVLFEKLELTAVTVEKSSPTERWKGEDVISDR